MNPNEKWYSVKEVAALFGVSSDSVRRWIKWGKLKAFKMPSRSPKRKRIFECFRVSSSELDRFRGGNMTS